ncbi:MAG TPA: hypothetical protein VHR66_27785 [Gemmataceae bacterium]|jgi:acetylornithine deacetylase/succinyl-diaminopimelate desuccinylase-like protein|nr:hypothetical protein [Gemmataceae bacterium]
MNKFTILALALIAFELPTSAAPALGDKPVKWEYCELQMTRSLVRPAPLGVAGGAAPVPAAIEFTIRFTTGDEEITVKTWEELADKLKAPAPKKEATENVHRLRVWNRLGAEGWEYLEHTGPTSTAVTLAGTGTWIFKRRVP